jgi:hypothetical protein
MKQLIIRRPAEPTPQANAISSRYGTPLAVSYGKVESNNTDGTANIKLATGFIVRIRIPSTVWPAQEPVTGGIIYPPVGAEVMIYHPVNDLNSGFIYPVNLNTRNKDVEEELLDQGDKEVLPGGWEKTYDQEKGILTFKNGDLLLTIDPDTKKIDILDFNANKILLDDAGLNIEDLHGNTFKSNSSAWEINGNTNNAVQYQALETAFNQLKQDFDNFVATVYGVHVHIVTTPDTINGTASPTTNQGVPSTADITGAKIANIKVS